MAPLRRNVGPKLFAAAIAFALWLFVNAGQRETAVFEFPIELANLPKQSMVVNNDRLDVVSVKLNGPGALLASLDPHRIPIELDLGDMAVGPAARRKIRNHLIHVPRGVRILDIEPSRVPIRLETIKRRDLPIKLTTSGEPKPGFRVAEIEVAPNEVRVRGPESVVEKLKAIETEPLNLEGIDSGSKRSAALVSTDPLLSFAPERAAITIRVKQVIETREIAQFAVMVRNVDRPFRLHPAHVKLTVRGPQIALEALTLPAGSVWVDGGSLAPGKHTIEPTADLPAGLSLSNLEPKTLVLEIQDPEVESGPEGEATPAAKKNGAQQ